MLLGARTSTSRFPGPTGPINGAPSADGSVLLGARTSTSRFPGPTGPINGAPSADGSVLLGARTSTTSIVMIKSRSHIYTYIYIYTVPSHYNMINFLLNPCKGHPIAPRYFFVCEWIQILICIPLQSLEWCMQYHVILDRVITALDNIYIYKYMTQAFKWCTHCGLKLLWKRQRMWRQRTGSISAQVMDWCLSGINWTNVDLLSVRSCDNRLRANS